MGPEFFLIENLKTPIVFLHTMSDHMLIFDEIESTGRIYHLSASLECVHSRIEQAFLEMSNLLDILDMPVLHRFSTLEEGSFAATWSIEKNPVKCFWVVFPLLPWIESDGNIWGLHPFEILEKLWYTFPRWLIGNNKSIREIFSKLGGFSAGAGCHIEDEEII